MPLLLMKKGGERTRNLLELKKKQSETCIKTQARGMFWKPKNKNMYRKQK